MSKLSKREKSTRLMKQIEGNLACPICQSTVRVNATQLICEKKHAFDIAKQGYVNLLTHATKTNYDKDLFLSRNKLITGSDFFTPLHQQLSELIMKYIGSRHISILDAGAGEGSHLHIIHNRLKENLTGEMVSVGIDIAKEGILNAAKHYENPIWFVADIANTPFKEKSFHVVLNILSPANYDEFTRVLKHDGMIIKVVPQKNYLKQLREFNDDGRDNNRDYINERIVHLFYDHFNNVEQTQLQYDVVLNEENLHMLLQMTPLTWNWSQEKINQFKKSEVRSITVDFDILIGFNTSI